ALADRDGGDHGLGWLAGAADSGHERALGDQGGVGPGRGPAWVWAPAMGLAAVRADQPQDHASSGHLQRRPVRVPAEQDPEYLSPRDLVREVGGPGLDLL